MFRFLNDSKCQTFSTNYLHFKNFGMSRLVGRSIGRLVGQSVSQSVIVLTPGLGQILNMSPHLLECYYYNVLIKIARTYL